MSVTIKPRRCPKCGATAAYFNELWIDHAIVFDSDDGFYDGREGIIKEGRPYGVEAICQEGHTWRLRGITQITELKQPD
jgi:hypothetical protein